jgi:hypothetical protein
MKQATITLTDDLEKALNRYMDGFATPPELDVVVRRALETYLAARGYVVTDTEARHLVEMSFVPSVGGKPKPLANAPVLDDEHSVARAVIEDRR